MDGPMLLPALTLALAYTYAQDNPNRQVSYFIVTFSIKWLPYVMLAMTLVMASPGQALIQATGLLAAHCYNFFAKIWPEYGGGRRYIYTPQTVRRWFAKPGLAPTTRGAGSAYNMGGVGSQNVPRRQTGGGSGWTSGLTGGGWTSRGQGRRLGSD